MEVKAWWRNIDENKKIPSPVLALVKDAWHSGCWIQDNQTFQWYTPEEFKSRWEDVYVDDRRNGDNIKRFSVRDPMAGERVLKKKMRDAMADYLKFRTKMEDYYIFELKQKNR